MDYKKKLLHRYLKEEISEREESPPSESHMSVAETSISVQRLIDGTSRSPSSELHWPTKPNETIPDEIRTPNIGKNLHYLSWEAPNISASTHKDFYYDSKTSEDSSAVDLTLSCSSLPEEGDAVSLEYLSDEASAINDFQVLSISSSGMDESFNKQKENYENEEMILIGENRTRIPARIYRKISWDSCTMATRTLLRAVFDRETLATSSMSGKKSPAFPDKPPKRKLDSAVVDDIITTVKRHCGASVREIKSFITATCCDESKALKVMQTNRQTYH